MRGTVGPVQPKRIADQTGQRAGRRKAPRGTDLIDRDTAKAHQRGGQMQQEPAVLSAARVHDAAPVTATAAAQSASSRRLAGSAPGTG